MQFSLFRFHRISGVFINKFLYWASIILKSRALANWAIGAYGAPGRTRTCNLRFRRPLLCPVELLGHFYSSCWYNSRKNAEQLNHSASIISSNNFYWLIKPWSNKLVFLAFLLLMFFLFICIITFFSFNFTLSQILRFCYGTPPQTRTEKMQGLSLPRLPIVSVGHNDLTDNRRLYQFAYFPILVRKAGLEPANSGSLSKEISTGSNLVRIAEFKPAISWSRIMRSSSSCPISR